MDMFVGNINSEKTSVTECIICMEDFQETDEVVQLKCSPLHIFHQKCIDDWVKNGVNC